MSWTDEDWSEAVDKANERADKAQADTAKMRADLIALRDAARYALKEWWAFGYNSDQMLDAMDNLQKAVKGL